MIPSAVGKTCSGTVLEGSKSMQECFQTFSKMNEELFRCSGTQLKDHIFGRQEEMMTEGDQRRSQISSLEELKAYNQEMRKRFIEELGGLVETTEPLDARITRTQDMGDFVLENVMFKSRPHTYVTGNMYLPKGITYPAPAVLFVGGHANDGRMYEQYNKVCQVLTRAGLIVFAIDPTGQGERQNFYDPESGKNPVPGCVNDHNLCGTPAVALGKHLGRYFLCDQMRAVDYMISRPEIDPERIGMTGSSGGGTQTVAMMVCDDRIHAAAPGTFVTTRREFMYTGMPQDMEQIWPACAQYGFDHVNALMLFAPKPVAILAVSSDFFPIEGTQETLEEAKRIYGFYGKEENVRVYEDDFYHCYTMELAVRAAEFFSEVFLGEKKTPDTAELLELTHETLRVTESGQVLGELADALPVQEEVRIGAAGMRESRRMLPDAERKQKAKEWLTRRVMYDRKTVDFHTRFFDGTKRKTGGYVGKRISWWNQKRLFAAGTIIKLEQYENTDNLPTVIAVWDDGTKRIAEHEEWICGQCASGKQVLVLDVPGVGNIEQYKFTSLHSLKGDYGTMFHLGCDLFYMGDSMAAMHCYDVMRAVEMLEVTFGVPEDKVTLYCDGNDGVYGIMAGFLKEKVQMEYGENLLRSVEREILGQKVLQYDNTLNLIVPGMLKYFDYEELMR